MKLSKLKSLIDEQLKKYGDDEVFISVDVSTNDKDSPHRVFADVISLVNQGNGYAVLSEKTEDNFDSLS